MTNFKAPKLTTMTMRWLVYLMIVGVVLVSCSNDEAQRLVRRSTQMPLPPDSDSTAGPVDAVAPAAVSMLAGVLSRADYGELGYSPRLRLPLDSAVSLPVVDPASVRQNFLSLAKSDIHAWDFLAKDSLDSQPPLKWLASGRVIVAPLAGQPSWRELDPAFFPPDSQPVLAAVSDDGRFLALGLVTKAGGSALGLLVDRRMHSVVSLVLPGLPLYCLPATDGSSFWLCQAGLVEGQQRLAIFDHGGRILPLPAGADQIAAGFAGASFSLVDQGAGPDSIALAAIPAVEQPVRLVLWYKQASAVEILVLAMPEGMETAVAGTMVEQLNALPPQLLPRTMPQTGETPVYESSQVSSVQAVDSTLQAKTAISGPTRSDDWSVFRVSLSGARLEPLPVVANGAKAWLPWLVRPSGQAEVAPAFSGESGNRGILLVRLDGSQTARSAVFLDWSDSDDTYGEPVLSTVGDWLFALVRGMDGSLRVARYTLDQDSADSPGPVSGQADWQVSVPGLVEAASPSTHLLAEPSGGCIVAFGEGDGSGPLKLIALEADGKPRWTRLVERPAALHSGGSLAPPVPRLVGSTVQIFWPPLRVDALALASGSLNPGAFRSAWLAEFALADGVAQAWSLALPEVPWQRLEMLGASATGFLAYEPLRGRFVVFGGQGGSFSLRQFVSPRYVIASQEGYDLAARTERSLVLESSRGAALVRLGPPGSLEQAELAGLLGWDETDRLVLIRDLSLGRLDTAAGSLGVFRHGPDWYLRTLPVSGFAGLLDGDWLVGRLDPLAVAAAEPAVEEPVLQLQAEPYSLRLAMVSGLVAAVLERPAFRSPSGLLLEPVRPLYDPDF